MTENTSLFDLIVACCQGIKNFCLGCWHFCGKCVRLSLRKWYITAPMVIIGIGLGFWGSNIPNRFWYVDATAILNGPTPELVANRYNDLNKMLPAFLLASQSKTDLLKWEGEDKDCFKFMKFESFPVIDCQKDSVPDYIDFENAYDPTDTTCVAMQNRLHLRFVTRDLKHVAQAQEVVLNYLNSDPQLIATYDAYRADLEREAQFCERQVNLLDSFTTVFYFQQGASTHLQLERWQLLIGDREVTLLHPEIIELMRHQKYVDHELALCTAPVVLQSGFMVNPRAINRRSNTMFIGMVVFYLLSLLISVLVEQKQAFREWMKQ